MKDEFSPGLMFADAHTNSKSSSFSCLDSGKCNLIVFVY